MVGATVLCDWVGAPDHTSVGIWADGISVEAHCDIGNIYGETDRRSISTMSRIQKEARREVRTAVG